ncbi:MAG: hypothetical protein Q9227_002721 [Pyrenula ochraceoflavens]
MPHKHKRRKQNDQANDFNLPPVTSAKPLSARPTRLTGPDVSKTKSKKVRRTATKTTDDDTPKAFARLMQYQAGKRLPSGLDDGSSSNLARGKKRKRTTNPDPDHTASSAQDPTQPATQKKEPLLTILPGEKLSDFSARVDQALPLNLNRNGTTTTARRAIATDPQTSKLLRADRLTKHARHLQRLQRQWREEEQQRREKSQATLADKEDEREEEELLWMDVREAEAAMKKRKRKGGGGGGEDGDPWATVGAKRKGMGQRNLQDVVEAPPKLGRVRARLK